MEIEPKVITTFQPEQGLIQRLLGWFTKWDRSKLQINGPRVRLFIALVATFFTAYSLLCAMSRIDEVKRNEIAVKFHIPDALLPGPNVAVISDESVTRPARGSSSQYSGPQVIYRASAGIPPGTLAHARLITGASDGPVRAEILRDVFVNAEKVIEAGTQLLGNGASTDERLHIRFERLVKRDGATSATQAEALDGTDRIAGIKGNRVSREMTKLAAGIGLNFVGGMSEGLQETDVKGGVIIKNTSVKNALLNGTTHAAVDQSKELISSFKEKAPRIEVERGRQIQVIFGGGG